MTAPLSRQPVAPERRDDAPAGPLEKAFLVFAMLGQQGAFSSMLWTLQGRESDAIGEASDPVNVFFVAVTLAGMFILFCIRPHLLTRITRYSPLILIACAYAISSALWSEAKLLAFKRAGVHFSTVLVALYLPARLGFDKAVRLIAGSILICAVLSFLAGLLVPRVGVMHTIGSYGRWRGIYAHKNPMAQAMGVGVMLQYYIAITSRNKVLPALAVALQVLLVVLANSVTVLSIIVFATGGYVMFLIATRGGALRPLVVIALAPLAAAFAIAIMFEPNLFHAISGRDATLTGRTQLWAWVWQVTQEEPFFGHGLQEFWNSGAPIVGQIWAAIGWQAPNAHNGFLEVALEMGAAGVLLVAMILVEALVRSLGLIRSPTTINQMGASLIILAGVIIQSGSEAVLFRQEDIDWFMVVMISFAAATTVKALDTSRPLTAVNILDRARPLSA